MTKKEFEERLARLGAGPVGPDLGPQVLYLMKKVNILARYLLEQKGTPQKSNVKEEEIIARPSPFLEGKKEPFKDDPETTP